MPGLLGLSLRVSRFWRYANLPKSFMNFGRDGQCKSYSKLAGLKRLLADDVQGSFQEVENVISADSQKNCFVKNSAKNVSQKFFGKFWQKPRWRQVTCALPVVNHQRHGRPAGSAEIPIGRHTDTKMHRFGLQHVWLQGCAQHFPLLGQMNLKHSCDFCCDSKG